MGIPNAALISTQVLHSHMWGGLVACVPPLQHKVGERLAFIGTKQAPMNAMHPWVCKLLYLAGASHLLPSKLIN